MTYKEYVSEKCPHRVDKNAFGGMRGCPGSDDVIKDGPVCGKCNRGPGPSNCTDCWNTEMPEEKKEEPKIDVHKIIDDAMEKGDRTVSIYIGQSCMTVNVTPYEKEEPARWIFKTDHYPPKFICSACDGMNDCMTPYCPHCGEQMKMPKEEDTDD